MRIVLSANNAIEQERLRRRQKTIHEVGEETTATEELTAAVEAYTNAWITHHLLMAEARDNENKHIKGMRAEWTAYMDELRQRMDEERAMRAERQTELERLNQEEADRSAARDKEDDERIETEKQAAQAQLDWQEQIASGAASYAINAIEHRKSAKQIIRDINRMIARQIIFTLLKKGLSVATGGASGGFGKFLGFVTGNKMPSARQGVTNFGGGPLQVHKDEVIWAPPNTNVLSQSASRAMMGGGGGAQVVEVSLHGDLANLVDRVDRMSQNNERSGVGPAVRMASR